MRINVTQLENKIEKSDGRIIARCPACAAEGGDKKGEHLVIYQNGKFGCVAFPDDKQHRSKILVVAGAASTRESPRFSINKVIYPETKVLLKIGSLSSKEETPSPSDGGQDSAKPKSSTDF